MESPIVRNLGRRVLRLNAATQPPAPKRHSTKDLLIDSGERLFGQFGIDGVSLREIAAAAGQTNCTAVQYHFKDKSGLIKAILFDRGGRLELLRLERLGGLGARKSNNPRELLKVVWSPTMSIRDGNGQHTFCRFLLQYLLQPQVADSLDALRRTKEHRSLVHLEKALRLLRAKYRRLPSATFRARLSILGKMFLSAVVEHDNSQLRLRAAKLTHFDIEPILDMAIAAMGAPVTDADSRAAA